MNKIVNDSVITFYFQMVNKTQSDLELPEFSEIYLRLALKGVYGNSFELSEDVLQMYRKVIVLYYCEANPSLASVVNIMERCFGKEEIYNIIHEKNSIIEELSEFQNNYMTIS